MALGKNRGNGEYNRSFSFGRKRITVSNEMDMEFSSTFHSPLKKQRSFESNSNSISDKFALESLPQDLLVNVLCDVDHDDVKQLVHVSKSIKEATLIANKVHFQFSTPKKTLPFRDSFSLGDEEMEAPNAPKQNRVRGSRLNRKKLLFGSQEKEDYFPRKDLLMEMEAAM